MSQLSKQQIAQIIDLLEEDVDYRVFLQSGAQEKFKFLVKISKKIKQLKIPKGLDFCHLMADIINEILNKFQKTFPNEEDIGILRLLGVFFLFEGDIPQKDPGKLTSIQISLKSVSNVYKFHRFLNEILRNDIEMQDQFQIHLLSLFQISLKIVKSLENFKKNQDYQHIQKELQQIRDLSFQFLEIMSNSKRRTVINQIIKQGELKNLFQLLETDEKYHVIDFCIAILREASYNQDTAMSVLEQRIIPYVLELAKSSENERSEFLSKCLYCIQFSCVSIEQEDINQVLDLIRRNLQGEIMKLHENQIEINQTVYSDLVKRISELGFYKIPCRRRLPSDQTDIIQFQQQQITQIFESPIFINMLVQTFEDVSDNNIFQFLSQEIFNQILDSIFNSTFNFFVLQRELHFIKRLIKQLH